MQELMDRVREIARENERLFEQLISGERRYRALAKAVWRVQEEERRRIARDLHDGIGQTLTALKNHLQRLRLAEEAGPAGPDGDAAAARAGLDEALALATEALEETRELSRLLRPPVLDDLGLEPALRWLVRTVGERSGLEIEADLRSVGSSEVTAERPAEIAAERLPRLDAELETLVFRVVQECLTNVLKHAAARRVRVTLRRDGARLEVEVEDDGSGFDPASAMRPGSQDATLGLRGMRDRAELFGGRLEIDSEPGAGTRVRVRVPVDGSTQGAA